MALRAGDARQALSRTALEAMLLAACLCAVLVSVLILLMFGIYALVLPALVGIIFLLVVHPKAGLLVVMAAAIVVEPGIDDWTMTYSSLFYTLPEKWAKLLPLTMSPFEMLLGIGALSLALRPGQWPRRAKLPVLVWTVPLAMLAGVAVGLSRGGDQNIAYHEMRGLIFGAVVFFVALRLGKDAAKPAIATFIAASGALAVIAIIRYESFLANGKMTSEVAFAHETPVFLSIGVVLSLALAVREERGWKRVLLLMFVLLLGAAIIATSRRAGTLVLLTGVLTLAGMTFRHRPTLVISLGVIGLVVGGAYLGAYWNKTDGATAQPARAIRSQFAPSARDESSDTYRVTEMFNVSQTIRLNRLLGVGFGRPFAQFQPLPNLTAFWPLQQYIPHQNVMWLWLKLGILGISAVLAFVVIALRRAINGATHLPLRDPDWLVATLAAATILMYLAYATVDIAFASTRSIAPLAAALALAASVRFEPEDQQ